MKKLLIALLSIVLAGNAAAQQNRTHDYGIIFGIGNNFLSTPVNIMENGIGAIIHMDNYALRPILQFGTTSEDNGAKSSATIFGLGAAYIKHINENRIAPFYGAGLNFTSGKQKNGTERKSSEFSVYGLFGVDVYIYKNVRLGAEYQMGLYTNSSKIDYASGQDSKYSSSSFGVSAVIVILSIFFM